MAERSQLWLLLPRQLRALPADMFLVFLHLFLVNLVFFLPWLTGTFLRVLLGIPLVLFVPGYTIVALLFPESSGQHQLDDVLAYRNGIDGLVRVALSFGVSIAVVPLVALLLSFSPIGLRGDSLVLVLSVGLAMTAGAAIYRRWQLPADQRFRVPYRRWLGGLGSRMFDADSHVGVVVNALLVLSVVLAVGGLAYAVTVPNPGEQFTDFYLLTETENGNFVADQYPTEFTAGRNESLVVGIDNQEQTPVAYTVLAVIQRVNTTDNTTRVRDEQRLTRFRPTLQPGERWRHPHTIGPTMTGDQLRLVYLLYKGPPPEDPTVDNAYRELHLWVNVTAPDTA